MANIGTFSKSPYLAYDPTSLVDGSLLFDTVESAVVTPITLASNRLPGSAVVAPITLAGKKLAGSAVVTPITHVADILPGHSVPLLAGENNVFTSIAPSVGAQQRLIANAQTASINVTYHGFTPQAKAAFEYAVDIWESLIVSSVTIDLDAFWKPLDPGVLGSCGPNSFFRNFSGGQAGTWYPAALASKLAG